MTKQNKHNSLCTLLGRLLKDKRYVEKLRINIEYDRGECDVWYRSHWHDVYIEVKSNYKPKNFMKAIHQTSRWARYMKKRKDDRTYYGVYYSPQTGLRIVTKDGKIRNKELPRI